MGYGATISHWCTFGLQPLACPLPSRSHSLLGGKAGASKAALWGSAALGSCNTAAVMRRAPNCKVQCLTHLGGRLGPPETALGGSAGPEPEPARAGSEGPEPEPARAGSEGPAEPAEPAEPACGWELPEAAPAAAGEAAGPGAGLFLCGSKGIALPAGFGWGAPAELAALAGGCDSGADDEASCTHASVSCVTIQMQADGRGVTTGSWTMISLQLPQPPLTGALVQACNAQGDTADWLSDDAEAG